MLNARQTLHIYGNRKCQKILIEKRIVLSGFFVFSISGFLLVTLAAAEFALKDHCWMPYGIQTLSIDTYGGEFHLETQEEGEPTVSIEVLPGTVMPEEGKVDVDYSVIPEGPCFLPPEGYQFGSMVMYFYYDGQSDTAAFKLNLPHWYGGEHHVRDGLSFAMAPCMPQKGEQVYCFETVEGGELGKRSGTLHFSRRCVLLAVVFRKGATSSYHASLWTHRNSPTRLCTKVVFTYSHMQWLKVCSVHA